MGKKEEKTPKVKTSGVVFRELPPDHPIYREGIIVGGRITRKALVDKAGGKEKTDRN